MPNHEQAILFFECKVSKSRHIVSGHGPVKSLAFVEELWTFKPPARRVDILTSEFNVRRLYRTSPTPSLGANDYFGVNCVGFGVKFVYGCMFACKD